MTRQAKAGNDLDFLKFLKSDRSEEYRAAWWLKSDFNDPVWNCEFGRKPFSIDFNVLLEDGSLLTQSKNSKLLEVFKCWMCVQTHYDATGQILIGEDSAFHRVSRILRFIDYFLIHTSRLKLSKFGIEALSSSDIKNFFCELSESRSTTNSLLKWNQKLSEFLKSSALSLTRTELNSIIKDEPDLEIINLDDSERILDLNDDELISARAFLLSHGLYIQRSASGYRFSPNTVQLAELIYPNTLWAKKYPKPIPEELQFSEIDRYIREYPAVPVRVGIEDQLSFRNLMEWRLTFRTLGLLGELGLPIPKLALNAINDVSFLENISLKSDGRFRTLPQDVVFTSLKNAIEFSLEYGEELVTAYLNLVSEAKKNSTTIATYCYNREITYLLPEKIQNLGIKYWHLAHVMGNIESNPNRGRELRQTSEAYFSRFRANEGLFELLAVLYGAIQICVGTLTARRQGELTELIAGKCLDKKRRYVIFENRKSGIAGMRDKEARPIPDICQRLINILEKLQFRLIELGILDNYTRLFSTPSRSNFSMCVTHVSYGNCIDTFCDYFQTPLDSNGRRYYLRQHQLRRFFAMLFFWGRSFGGMDTLRWFLGHTDMEHLYHYITESMTGTTLLWAKASYCVDQIKNHDESADGLADLIERHFSTRVFSILDSEEMEEYIYELIADGTVEVEPIFFSAPNGKDYKVIVKVLREIA